MSEVLFKDLPPFAVFSKLGEAEQDIEYIKLDTSLENAVMTVRGNNIVNAIEYGTAVPVFILPETYCEMLRYRQIKY